MDAIGWLNNYQVNGDVLVDYQRRSHPKLSFDSTLHSLLAYHLQDPQLAYVIHNAYVKHIDACLTPPQRETFSAALIRVATLFGTPKHPPTNALRRILLQDASFEPWLEQHSEAYEQFIAEANQSLYLKPKKTVGTPYSVVVVSTTDSGGNWSVAEGVKAVLEQTGLFKVKILDAAKYNVDEPLMKATGKLTFDKVYAKIAQQLNRMDIYFDVHAKILYEVSQYFQHTVARVLKEKTLKYRADFFISTRNYNPVDMSVPHSLGIPGAILHCDREIGFFYQDFIGKLSPLVQIWLDTPAPRTFKPLFDQYKIDWQHVGKDRADSLSAIAKMLGAQKKEIKAQLEFVGFPTHPDIFLISDPSTIDSLRGKWGLQPDEICIPVILGKNGVGSMRGVFDRLLKSPAHKVPIHYIFVTGDNDEMKSEFQAELAKDRSNSALKRCQVTGLLSRSEVNELLNICLFTLGKPGGAQTEEARICKKRMMVIDQHDGWETGNRHRLEEDGLILLCDKNRVAEQIEQYANDLTSVNISEITSVRWQEEIPKAVVKLLSAHGTKIESPVLLEINNQNM